MWFLSQLRAEQLPEASVVGKVKHSSVKKYPTLVYVELVENFKPEDSPKVAVMNQKGKAFVPRLLPILAGTTVEFFNNDNFEHNVFCPDYPPGENEKKGQNYYDLGRWDKGLKRTYTFNHLGVYTQLCALHPEMVAYIVVLQNHYFVLTDEEGKFRISGIPVGNWKFKVWNERLKPKQLEKTYGVLVEEGRETEVVLEP